MQTEEERGESGFALPIEIDSSHDITLANFRAYRVISSFQPFPCAVKVSNSRDIHIRNFHCDSNSKVSFDDAVYDQTHAASLRQREFASLDIAGDAPEPAAGAAAQKLAGGFFNISGGAVGPDGDFYFVDAHWQRIYRWRAAGQQLATVSDAPLDPVNLAVDSSGGLLVVSYAGQGTVYVLNPNVSLLKPEAISARPAAAIYLPVSDWRFNRDALSRPAACFVSLDKSVVLPVGDDFLSGATSWGVKSSPQIRSFGLARATPGQRFYVTSESEMRTWSAAVNPDGSLTNIQLFAEQGGEGVTSDNAGHVYIAAGQILDYDAGGNLLRTIRVPERPTQLLFGGAGHRTLFITARTSLYALDLARPPGHNAAARWTCSRKMLGCESLD